MDRGGRFHEPLIARREPAVEDVYSPPSRLTLLLRRATARLAARPLRLIEFLLFVALFGSTGVYGAVRGGHADHVLAAMRDTGDAVARVAGFAIVNADVRGARYIGRGEVLERAGVTPYSSLLLLDAESMRARLKTDPRIADVAVRKYFPDRLEIVIEERAAFARWQRGGKIHLIANDGTVLEQEAGPHAAALPLVVGAGAEKRAQAFLNLMQRYPAIMAQLRAGVLVAERRWNLHLKNGIAVRLPEEDPTLALERLIALDREKQILSRDVTVIDLRAPDRVSVGLSEEAAAAREKRPKRAGADS